MNQMIHNLFPRGDSVSIYQPNGSTTHTPQHYPPLPTHHNTTHHYQHTTRLPTTTHTPQDYPPLFTQHNPPLPTHHNTTQQYPHTTSFASLLGMLQSERRRSFDDQVYWGAAQVVGVGLSIWSQIKCMGCGETEHYCQAKSDCSQFSTTSELLTMSAMLTISALFLYEKLINTLKVWLELENFIALLFLAILKCLVISGQ